MAPNELAPILLFVYQRPEHTRKTLQALSKNHLSDKSTLYIYSDGAKVGADKESIDNIKGVRKVIREQKWCKEVHIIESKINKGLANSIIDGVTEKVDEFGKAIVLEDDLETSEHFLKFMNDSLMKYANDEKVMQISGYQFPIDVPKTKSSFFFQLVSSWGWATWKRAWQKFDPLAIGYEKLKTDTILENKFNLNDSFPYSNMLIGQMEAKSVNSWAIRWYWTVFTRNGMTLFPDSSLIKNIGYGEGASHTKGDNPFYNSNFDTKYSIDSYPDEIQINKEYSTLLEKLLQSRSPSKIKRTLKNLLKYVRKLSMK